MNTQEKLEQLKSRITDSWNHLDCPKDWNELIVECHEKLVEIDPNYKLLQVKQKFGGLRYYFDTLTDNRRQMEEIVKHYEEQSFYIPHRH